MSDSEEIDDSLRPLTMQKDSQYVSKENISISEEAANFPNNTGLPPTIESIPVTTNTQSNTERLTHNSGKSSNSNDFQVKLAAEKLCEVEPEKTVQIERVDSDIGCGGLKVEFS